jgi:hypothetical protein
MGLSPGSPLRADHRFIKQLLTTILGGKVEHVPAEFDLLSEVFIKAGGSWESIFRGSPEGLDLLKKVIDVAFKNNRLTKKHRWTGGKTESETGKDSG